jgi:hypothetical protein
MSWAGSRPDIWPTSLVDRDPPENLALLLDPAKIQLVMKNGVIYKTVRHPALSNAALHLDGGDFSLREEGTAMRKKSGCLTSAARFLPYAHRA